MPLDGLEVNVTRFDCLTPVRGGLYPPMVYVGGGSERSLVASRRHECYFLPSKVRQLQALSRESVVRVRLVVDHLQFAVLVVVAVVSLHVAVVVLLLEPELPVVSKHNVQPSVQIVVSLPSNIYCSRL